MMVQRLLLVALFVVPLVAGCAGKLRTFPIVEVAPGIFEGGKPKTHEDFEVLRRHGIRTVFSLQTLPWNVRIERARSEGNGFMFRHVSIPAAPFKPGQQRVEEAVRALHDPSLRPVYIHCLLGFDRTTFIVGLYRVYYLGWTPEAAWGEMLRSGFHRRWALRGLETYFWSHAQRPDWANRGETETKQ